MFARMKGALLVTALIATLVVWAPAHERDDDSYRRNNNSARQHGYNHGYRDGFHHGREDRAYRAGYDYRNSDYKRADRGYHRSLGSKGQFKKGYRDGYHQGYDDAYYGRRARLGGIGDGSSGPIDRDRGRGRDEIYDDEDWWRYSDVGYRQGYRDGQENGRKEAQDHKSYSPENDGRYRDADRGYNSRYGDRENYKRSYRQGYLQGYRDGYGSPDWSRE